MKDKILVFNNYELNTTDGGPSGVIAQNIKNWENDFYILGEKIVYKTSDSFVIKVISKMTKYLFNPISKTVIAAGIYKTNALKNWLIDAQKIYININAKNFKYVLFHDVFNLGACLPLIPKTQKIILYPVTPELAYEEIKFQSDKFSAQDIEWAKINEINAFKRADILLFANEGAKQIFKDLIPPDVSVYYIPYAAQQIKSVRQFPFDSSKINFLYIGRRIPIKGFDIVLNAFKKAICHRKDINLILAGNSPLIEGENIYDIGFTKDPHSLINSVDYVISANTQSYFDLAVLETLSIGTPVIMTMTYGHEIFKKYKSPSLIEINPDFTDSLYNILISNDIQKKNTKLMEYNKTLYREYFSTKIYHTNLINFYHELN